MSCQEIFCFHEECSGACGTSSSVREYFEGNQYQQYCQDKEKIFDEYFEVAVKFPDMINKLFHPKLFSSINNFDSRIEAYQKLFKLKELINCLKEK